MLPRVCAVFLSCVGALVSIGCTSSVYPLTGAPTEELDLSGSWVRTAKEGHGPPQVTLRPAKSNGRYLTTVGEQELEITVITIGDNYYINARPLLDAVDMGGGLPSLQLPLNLFARIELHGDELHLFPIDEKTARGFITRHKLAYLEPEKCHHVLTVPSDRLNQLVEEHWSTLFVSSPTLYLRQKTTRSDEKPPQ